MRRIKLLFILFCLAWLVLVSRLFYWQIGSSDKFFLEANNQYQTKEEISALRGKIFASDGFPLALSKENYTLFIQPNLVKDEPDKIYQKLTQFVPLNSESFLKIAKDSQIHWYPLIKELESEIKDQITKEKIDGIGFDPQWQRAYPEASIAAHLLGFVGSDNLGRQRGYFGLEGFYDREFQGKTGELFWEKDLLGRRIIIGQGEERKPKSGRDLKLFLDRSMQFLLEKELKKGIEKYSAVSGSLTILDPFTGGILAMASFPTYDPQNFFREDKVNFSNPVISSSFEPGSVLKPFVMAAAIDLGLVTPKTICDQCSGPVQIGEYEVKTWNDKYYPNTNMLEIIQHSDNVGMVFVSRKIGVRNLLHYLDIFGFSQKTGIDLQEESNPELRKENDWKEIDLATAGFGQGVAVTPIQLIRAMAAIANGGKLITPKVVEKIIDGDKEIKIKIEEGKQVIKPITAKIITEMMVNAVENGEAKWAKPKGYKIAGKTGTAQIPIAGHYDKEKTVASFIGFAPADEPRFVMLVMLREPKVSPWASETAAPLWFEMAKKMLQLLGVPPS